MPKKEEKIGDLRIGAFRDWPSSFSTVSLVKAPEWQQVAVSKETLKPNVGKKLTKRPSRTRPPKVRNNI